MNLEDVVEWLGERVNIMRKMHGKPKSCTGKLVKVAGNKIEVDTDMHGKQKIKLNNVISINQSYC